MDPAFGLKKIKINDLEKIYTNVAIVLYPEKELMKVKENKYRLFKLKMFYKKIIIILLITLFIVILSLLFNSYLTFIIDNIKYKNLTLIINITLLFLLIILIKLLLQFLKNKIIIKTDVFLDKYLSNKFIEHLFKISYLFFKTKQTGEILSRFNDIKIIKDVIILFISEILFNSLLFMLALIFCYKIDPKIFIILLSLLILNIVISLIIYLSYKKRSKEIIEEDAYFNSLLTEYITNIETIRNLNIINKVIDKLKNIYLNNLSNVKTFYNKINFNTSIKYLINDFNYLIIIFIMTYLIINSNKTIGELVYVSIIYTLIINSLNTFYAVLPEVSLYKNALYRIKEILKYKTVKLEENKDKLQGDIIVKNLCITYNKIDYINKDLNFIIKYKSNTLITGKSGSGKSTFIKILKKYLNVYEGSIFINNINLNNINYSVLNNNILYVSQKEKLFSDTIENNIKINNDDSKLYNEIIDLTYVNEIINKKRLKDKYFIEENSFNISGGEKQRIVLARALMNNFEYIVLDEALSEVDKNIEKNIIINLKNKYKDKTIIYISHNEKIKELFDEYIKF